MPAIRIPSLHLRLVIGMASIIILLPIKTLGQEVGLVLSGGGAKGVAHIGVIKALEEEGIPINYIAGTSMGAIIGALYAIGWTTDQMTEVILSEEFKTWVKGEITDEYRFYFKKPAPNASWVNLRFGTDTAFRYKPPLSIVSPFVMDFQFLEFYAAASAAANYDFDNLFVPFRCVAANVAKNKAITLRDGSLDNAVRASMTFPFYFRPIRIDGQLLFDGGIYNNFPADVMVDEFYPEIIIGSKVAGAMDQISEDDLLAQLEAMVTSKTSYEIPCDNGILISPALPRINVIDFRNSEAFIDSGYVATKRLIPEIRKFVYDTVNQQELAERRKAFMERKPPIIVDNIEVTGLDEAQTEYVKRSLSLGEGQVPIDKVKTQYFRLIADENINYIFPSLTYIDTSGFYTLHLDIKRENELQVEFGGIISTSPISTAFIGLRYNSLGLNSVSATFNSYIGRYYSSALISGRIDFPGKLPVYVETGFILNRWDYFRTSNYFFGDEKPSFLKESETMGYVHTGIPVAANSKAVVGIAPFLRVENYFQTNLFTRFDTTDQTRFSGFSPFIIYEKNSLNTKQYANRGNYVNYSLRFVTGNEREIPGTTSTDTMEHEHRHFWLKLSLEYLRILEIKRNYRLGFYSELVLSNQGFFNNYLSTMLVAPSFSPTPEGQTVFLPDYRAHNYLGMGLQNIINLRRNLDFRIEAYAFLPYQSILADANMQPYYSDPFSTINLIGNAILVYNTPLGPLSIRFSYLEKGEDQLSLMLNFGYVIFNSSAF